MILQLSTQGTDISIQTMSEHAASGRCPCCGSDEIEGRGFDAVGVIAYQPMQCLREGCEAAWDDRYRLDGYVNAEQGGQSVSAASELDSAAVTKFRPGVYRHWKTGTEYLAHGLARCDETEAPVVVYTRLYSRDGFPMSTRLLSIWCQMVDPISGEAATGPGCVPRFEYVGATSAGSD